MLVSRQASKACRGPSHANCPPMAWLYLGTWVGGPMGAMQILAQQLPEDTIIPCWCWCWALAPIPLKLIPVLSMAPLHSQHPRFDAGTSSSVLAPATHSGAGAGHNRLLKLVLPALGPPAACVYARPRARMRAARVTTVLGQPPACSGAAMAPPARLATELQ